jgi:hypothetical protein
MEKLPTDVLFLLLGACPPPDYVNLAVPLCHVISRHNARRLGLSAKKKSEWEDICFEDRAKRWQDVLMKTQAVAYRLNPKYQAAYISLCSKVLADAKLDPSKDPMPDTLDEMYMISESHREEERQHVQRLWLDLVPMRGFFFAYKGFDVLFLLLGACPPPEYVNLAVALCHEIFRHDARRMRLSADKRVEWEAMCFENRARCWRDKLMKDRAELYHCNPKYQCAYISFLSKVLADAKLDPDFLDSTDEMHMILESNRTEEYDNVKILWFVSMREFFGPMA